MTDQASGNMADSGSENLAVRPVEDVVDHGGQTQVLVANSQSSVTYQLSVGGVPRGRCVDGNGTTIALLTGPLHEDTTFVIRATKLNDPDVSVPLRQQAVVKVRPDRQLSVSTAQTIIDSSSQTQVLVECSQSGVSYQLVAGGTTIGDVVEGDGATITLATGPLVADTTFVVRATKQSDLAISVTLQNQATVWVRPKATLAVTAADRMVDCNGATEIRVAASQPGVRYQLMTGGIPVGHAVDGNGSTILLRTGPLVRDTSFTVRATNINNADCSVLLGQQAEVGVLPAATPLDLEIVLMKSLRDIRALAALMTLAGLACAALFIYNSWPTKSPPPVTPPETVVICDICRQCVHKPIRHAPCKSTGRTASRQSSTVSGNRQLDAIDQAIKAVREVQCSLPAN